MDDDPLVLQMTLLVSLQLEIGTSQKGDVLAIRRVEQCLLDHRLQLGISMTEIIILRRQRWVNIKNIQVRKYSGRSGG